jgi:hypothetical protein
MALKAGIFRYSAKAPGRLTPMPDCIMGAVTMKMMSRTSMTSMNGVMLISAIAP